MSYKGIDVSHFQGNIDWNKVKGNIDFAILRLGWIGNNNNHTLDTKFETYYNACKSTGIPIGIYVYNYCNSEDTVKSGAEWTVNQLKDKGIDLPIYIDMEDRSIENLGKDKLTSICIAFNTVIENAGYWAGVYANLNWYTNYLNKDTIKARYTTWVAHYGISQDRYVGQYDMLQYSDTGKISGISGNVDMDIMYRDLINEIKESNTGTDRKTVEELAREVIDGKWGNGEERKIKLTNAGYDYSAVQAKVNEILGVDTSITNYYPAISSDYNSIVEALKSIGVDSSFNNRKKIAVKNGINNYTGTATQNIELLDKLKAGRLIKV
nr:GH25 family lysozyme [uncultured Romboutsia sp.]